VNPTIPAMAFPAIAGIVVFMIILSYTDPIGGFAMLRSVKVLGDYALIITGSALDSHVKVLITTSRPNLYRNTLTRYTHYYVVEGDFITVRNWIFEARSAAEIMDTYAKLDIPAKHVNYDYT
jgi:hypothetical protein